MAGDLQELRVKRITYEAESINSYELVLPAGGDLAPFTAGSHIDLHLNNGMIRSYSLVNDQSERHRYVIAVNRDAAGRGGSNFVHDSFKAGNIVTISMPRNNFALREDAESSLLIAGGIGITPLLSMIRRLQAVGRPWKLFYAARTRRAAAFLGELSAIGAGTQLHVHFDDENGGRPLDLATIVGHAPASAHLYCCGPVPMLEAFEKAIAGRPAEYVHVEYFQAKQAPAVDGGFEVRLARSNRTIAVEPGKTILNALLDAGIMANYSCSEGVCGTCETRVIEGIPDHRDLFLSPEEQAANKTIMICCSGSKSGTLVLDL
ncbi:MULTISPECIES: PDR/VanB family oxidoreductase [unclassified Bradyrhizobium]|uniref:PDR/VanB family oxidoreductase n=1 Tax=unclassified Bradyrhizobium TaxID=2631580 RepID=UPI00211EAED9|nr:MULTISPECIES: PDR/VanB family oxidoreductase [unclassified Bradyrhizobium]MDD1534740.1 oxidoreductase [Bradyrhizobium sp. WBOS8]MDD1584231.1 oxidoreductase [Bradyrhizobium sp. WBOS4]UUO50514.1 oxidoreductase [Bradyrhizobium sp. WBOS04]UUO57892.1 oxidoreductase [Bradyrhizobium sp. WBOS08]